MAAIRTDSCLVVFSLFGAICVSILLIIDRECVVVDHSPHTEEQFMGGLLCLLQRLEVPS